MTGRLEIQKDMGWSRVGPTVNDNDMNNILSYMARSYDLRADKLCWRAVTTAVYENSFHPIWDYLEELEWDGIERMGWPGSAALRQVFKPRLTVSVDA